MKEEISRYGAIVLTRIFLDPASMADERVRPNIACLVAEYRAPLATPRVPIRIATLAMAAARVVKFLA